MNTVFPSGPPSFGDNVRIRSSVETEAKGVVGLEGQVYGQTTPSATGVEVIGETTSDYAINVYFKNRDESFWFAPSLVEFISHAPGTEVTLDGVSRVAAEAERRRFTPPGNIMKLILNSVILTLLTSPVAAYGQARAAKCEVQPLWVGKTVRSSNFGLMGAFEKDGSEGAVIRSFGLKAEPLIATVGIDYVYEYSKTPQRPYEIRLAITVSDKEEEHIFESVNSSEAKTRYAKKWNLSVTKNVNVGDLVYMFSFRCWDAAGFGGKRPLD